MHVPDRTDPPRPSPYPMPDELERARRSLGVELLQRDAPRWVDRNRYADALLADGWSREDADRIAWRHFVPGVPWPERDAPAPQLPVGPSPA